jgi:hypothetical protein
MTRADLIAAVRTASDKSYLSERECLAIVRGVLGVVREPSGPMLEIADRALDDFRHPADAFTYMIDNLLDELEVQSA